MERHHIIGRQFAVDFYKFFKAVGFDIEASANFIDLPASDSAAKFLLDNADRHVSSHTGRHLKTYTEKVEEQLFTIREYLNKNPGQVDNARKAVDALVSGLRDGLAHPVGEGLYGPLYTNANKLLPLSAGAAANSPSAQKAAARVAANAINEEFFAKLAPAVLQHLTPPSNGLATIAGRIAAAAGISSAGDALAAVGARIGAAAASGPFSTLFFFLDPSPAGEGSAIWGPGSNPNVGEGGRSIDRGPDFSNSSQSGDFSVSFNPDGDFPVSERLGRIYDTEYRTLPFSPSQYHPGRDADGATRLPPIDIAGKAQAVQVENPVPNVEDGFHVEEGKDGYFYKVEDGSHLEKGGDGQYRSVTDGDSLSSSQMTFNAFGAFDNFFSGFGDFLSGFGDMGLGDLGIGPDAFNWQFDMNSPSWHEWWDTAWDSSWDDWNDWNDWPVILDLDGDGIEITPMTSSNVYFDMAGDGYQHQTAWVGAGDAVLAFDANNDGLINQKNEIVFTEWDPTAASDMQALLDVFDTNHNGKLDAGDAKFSQFKLVVTNANGTQTVQTLAQAGVASIDLKENNYEQTFIDGSTIDGQTTFTRTNGTTGTAASVSLVYAADGHALRTTTSTDGAGAVTVDNKAYNPDGALASETISVTSADGKSRTLSQDVNGDGVIDIVQTETTVVNPNGSKTTTLTDKTAGGVTLDKIVTTISADGKTTTIQRDMDASGNFEQTETLVTAADGSKTNTISNYSDNGTLITKISHATSANGLTRTDRFDENGDAVWDTTTTDATVVNGDGSRTETVAVTNANGALRNKTTIQTSADGRSKSTAVDLDGNATTDLTTTETVTNNPNGSYWTTTTDYNGDGALRDQAKTLLSADNLSKTSYVDVNGDGVWDKTTTDVTVVNGDGSRTETTTDYNANGSKRDQTVVVKGADGRSRTIQLDQNGDGGFDFVETIVFNAGGDAVDTSSNYNAAGTLINKTVVATSADGLTQTTREDLDANSIWDTITNATTTKVGGASTVTTTVTNGDGSLRGKTIVTTSANGLNVTTQADLDGNGTIDRTTTDATVVNPDNSRTETISQTSNNGALLAKSVISTSADRKTVTTTSDFNGDGATDRVESVVTTADGVTADTISDFNPNGALRGKKVSTINATGLSRTVKSDVNGDGVWDTTVSDMIALNADGSRIETIATTNANASLRAKTITTTNATGLSVTTQADLDGDGVWETTTTDVIGLNADGSRTRTVTDTNANGTKRDQATILTSATGLSVTTSTDLDGNRTIDLVRTDVTTLNADGGRVETIADVNGGSLRRKSTISTSVDGRSKTVAVDSNGDGQNDSIETVTVAANGETADTVTSYSPNGVKRGQTVTRTSANGLVTTVQSDADGNGVFEMTSTTTQNLNSDGSVVKTVAETNANGSLRDKAVTQTSANGLSTTNWIDSNGDGVWDTTTTDISTLNADGGATRTVSDVNANSSLRSKTATTLSADRRMTTITRDVDGNGANDQTETVQVQANDATVDTVSNFQPDGSVKNRRASTVAGNGLSSETDFSELVTHYNLVWVGYWLPVPYVSLDVVKTVTNITTLNADGSKVDAFTQYNGTAAGTIREQIVSTKSANGLSISKTWTGSNGAAAINQTSSDVTTFNADGSTTRVVTDQTPGGGGSAGGIGGAGGSGMLDKAVTNVNASKLKTTYQLDVNGDGSFDRTEISAVGVDGAKAETVTIRNLDGSLLRKEATTVSWDGLQHNMARDANGDGAYDHFESSRQEASGATSNVVWETRGGGALNNRIVSLSSANALAATLALDTNGDGVVDATQLSVDRLNADGTKTSTLSDFNANGTLRDRIITTVSANGLAKTTQINLNGLGNAIETETDITALNADGSVTRTVTDLYADGSLKGKSIFTSSANGKSATTTIDIDGDNVNDKTISVTEGADGMKASTVTFKDASTATTTTSFDGLTTTMTTSAGVTQTRAELGDGTGSYSWALADSQGNSIGSSSHTIDENGVDAYSYYRAATQTEGSYSGSLRISASALNEYQSRAERLYDTVFDRDMLIDEKETIGRYINSTTGAFNFTQLANDLINATEFSTRYGGLSNLQFVERIYQNALGRSASTAEITNYLKQLNAGTLTRADVMNTISENAEHVAMGNVHAATNNSVQSAASFALDHTVDKQQAKDMVTRLYQTALGRAPSASELTSGYQAVIAGSATEAGLANSIVSIQWVWWPYTYNPSVFDQTYGALSNSDFVTRVFLNSFGRNPTSAESADWVTMLNNGTVARGDIIYALAESIDHFAYIGAQAGQTVAATNQTLNYADNSIVRIIGAGDTINAGSGSVVTVGGNGAGGTDNLLYLSDGSASLLTDSRMDVVGSRNVVTAASGSNSGVWGSDNTINASGAVVWVGGSGNLVSGSGNTVVTYGANVDLVVAGDGNTINGQSGTKIAISTNGQSGAADVVNMSNGSLALAGGSKATVNGSGNTVALELGGNVTLSGSGNKIALSAGNDIVTDSGSSELFIFRANFGQDTITGFDSTDRMQIESAVFTDWAHLIGAAQQVGVDTLITATPTDTITLKNVAVSSLNQSQFQFT